MTSPTGIQEINRLMGTNLESELTDAVEQVDGTAPRRSPMKNLRHIICCLVLSMRV